jgi:choline dehydrogenase-like flavoprotein
VKRKRRTDESKVRTAPGSHSRPSQPAGQVSAEADINVDIVIVGSGAGGSTLAYALRHSGARILVVERGGFIPMEPQNQSAAAVYIERRYCTVEPWHTPSRQAFLPRIYYCVGGNTKFYGGHLCRFRESDFRQLEHRGGISPKWPFSYCELEPYYCLAEQIYRVRGRSGRDPTDPPRSAPHPFPEVPHEPYIAELEQRMLDLGLHPSPMPLAIGLGSGGGCVRCGSCDGFPCLYGAKGDAETRALRPALDTGSVELLTGTTVMRLETDSSGRRVTHAIARRADGRVLRIRAGAFALSAGAVNSAALLLRSSSPAHPDGLSNRSGLVGRRYMVHNISRLLAIDPGRRNPVVFQKTLYVNDFYSRGPGYDYPMGNIQLVGKLRPEMVADVVPGEPADEALKRADYSVDWLAVSEDLPVATNRVCLDRSGNIVVDWAPNNTASHSRLVDQARMMLNDMGFRQVGIKRAGIASNSHQCGTVVLGDDPARSVLDQYCRSHEVRNLFVVDASFFPSAAAMNPALTIIAQALRAADKGAILP